MVRWCKCIAPPSHSGDSCQHHRSLVKTQSLYALVLILLIVGATIIGITAVDVENSNSTILIFMGVATTIVTAVVAASKLQKNTESTIATEGKVDQLLNGSLQGRIATLERRVASVDYRLGNIEEVVLEIRDKVMEPPTSN
jgi:hypothetical protein